MYPLPNTGVPTKLGLNFRLEIGYCMCLVGRHKGRGDQESYPLDERDQVSILRILVAIFHGTFMARVVH